MPRPVSEPLRDTAAHTRAQILLYHPSLSIIPASDHVKSRGPFGRQIYTRQTFSAAMQASPRDTSAHRALALRGLSQLCEFEGQCEHLGIMALFSVFESVDFAPVFACAPHFAETSSIFCNLKLL